MSMYREAAQLLQRDLAGQVAETEVSAAVSSGDPRLVVQSYLGVARRQQLSISADTAAAVRDLVVPHGDLDPSILDGIALH